MVSVIKRESGKKTSYYLKHTSTSRQREVPLGESIPENIAELKEGFMFEFYREEWNPKLRRIAKNYRAESRRTPKKVAADNLDGLCIDLAYNTQRLGGSSMTFRETADWLMHDAPPLRRPEHERHEAAAHREIFQQMLKRRKGLDIKTVLGWHKRIFSSTDHADAGAVRRYPVVVKGSRSRFPPWRTVPGRLDAFAQWYDGSKKELNPAELAAVAHYRFASIRPFGDGNGRIARLIMNHTLHKNGYPMFVVRPADGLSCNRSLERSDLGDNAIFFVQWFMKRYIHCNAQYLDG